MGKRKNNFSIARRSLLENPNELKDICLFISGVKKWILGIFDNLSQNFESFRIYYGLCLKMWNTIKYIYSWSRAVYDVENILWKYNLKEVYRITWRKVVAGSGWIQRKEGCSWGIWIKKCRFDWKVNKRD